jgi:hypothetical protein
VQERRLLPETIPFITLPPQGSAIADNYLILYSIADFCQVFFQQFLIFFTDS